MNNFNRKVEDASARVSKTVAEAAERIEKEIPEFIKYLNDEVVPAVRQHSTKALRTASLKLNDLADFLRRPSLRPPHLVPRARRSMTGCPSQEAKQKTPTSLNPPFPLAASLWLRKRAKRAGMVRRTITVADRTAKSTTCTP